jgi:hypothetical protein
MVHVWAKILLFFIWYGAVLIQILLFITWTEVLLFTIWHAACWGRRSVHYLIRWILGQKFCFSLSDMEHVWTPILVFIISHILQLGSSGIYSEVSFFPHFCQIRTILLIFSVIFSDHTSSEAQPDLNLIYIIDFFLAVERPEYVLGP